MNDLSEKLETPAPSLLAELTMLEMQQLVQALPGGRYSLGEVRVKES